MSEMLGTGVTPNRGRAPSPGQSYAPGTSPTVGPQDWPYRRNLRLCVSFISSTPVLHLLFVCSEVVQAPLVPTPLHVQQEKGYWSHHSILPASVCSHPLLSRHPALLCRGHMPSLGAPAQTQPRWGCIHGVRPA